MAGMDYVDCTECGKRLFYDGEWRVRADLEESSKAGITCDRCVKKLKQKIEKLKKHDRRRH